MNETLKENIQKLLNSDDVINQKVGLNALLSDEFEVEDRWELFQPFINSNCPEEIIEEVGRVFSTLHPIVKKNRIKEL
jgi:hypothetical protein